MNEDEIHAARTRAYHIWENQGRSDGEHESHWQQALRELGLLPPFDGDRSAIAEQARKWDEEEGRS
jgi:hypothetical protein